MILHWYRHFVTKFWFFIMERLWNAEAPDEIIDHPKMDYTKRLIESVL